MTAIMRTYFDSDARRESIVFVAASRSVWKHPSNINLHSHSNSDCMLACRGYHAWYFTESPNWRIVVWNAQCIPTWTTDDGPRATHRTRNRSTVFLLGLDVRDTKHYVPTMDQARDRDNRKSHNSITNTLMKSLSPVGTTLCYGRFHGDTIRKILTTHFTHDSSTDRKVYLWCSIVYNRRKKRIDGLSPIHLLLNLHRSWDAWKRLYRAMNWNASYHTVRQRTGDVRPT